MAASITKIEKRQDWDETAETEGFIYVKAVAHIQIPSGEGGYYLHEVESPGLFGIDDESSAEYVDSVYAEERETLLDMLRELGLNVDAETPAPATTYGWGYNDSEEYVYVSRDHAGGRSEDLFDVTLYDKNYIDPNTGRNAMEQSLVDLRALIGYANAAIRAGLEPVAS